MIPTPSAVGLHLCEQGIIDRGSDFPSLINLFNKLQVRAFPSEPKDFVAFATLTDTEGSGTMKLKCFHQDSQQLVYDRSVVIHIPNRLVQYNLLLRLRGVSFPEAGWYEFCLLIDGELVALRRFRVYRPSPP